MTACRRPGLRVPLLLDTYCDLSSCVCRRRVKRSPLSTGGNGTRPAKVESAQRGGLGGVRPRYRAEGMPIKSIARQLGIGRNTVRCVLASDGPTEVPAADQEIDRGRGRTADPAVAGAVADRADDGDRRTDQLDQVANRAQGSRDGHCGCCSPNWARSRGPTTGLGSWPSATCGSRRWTSHWVRTARPAAGAGHGDSVPLGLGPAGRKPRHTVVIEPSDAGMPRQRMNHGIPSVRWQILVKAPRLPCPAGPKPVANPEELTPVTPPRAGAGSRTCQPRRR